MTLGTILVIVLILLLLGVIPNWGYSSGWGYGPSGIIGTILIVVGIVMAYVALATPALNSILPSGRLNMAVCLTRRSTEPRPELAASLAIARLKTSPMGLSASTAPNSETTQAGPGKSAAISQAPLRDGLGYS